jgi:acyl-CoA thioesterase I
MIYRWLAWMIVAALLNACGSSSNSEDMPPPVDGPLAYLALGASDAFGIGAFPLENGYVYRSERALESERTQPVDLTNLGIPGALADDILNVLDIALVGGARPDLVTIWTGANDLTRGRSPTDFEADLDTMLTLLSEDTSALIFLADLPDLTALPRFIEEPDPDVTPERVAAFNAVIEAQAVLRGITLVRLSALPVEAELTSDVDGFHPSNEGHARIAEAFLQAIRPALGLPEPE